MDGLARRPSGIQPGPGCALWRPSNNLARLYAPIPPFRRGLAVSAGPVHPDRGRVRVRPRRRRPDVLHLHARRDPDGGADGQGDRGARRPGGPGHRRPAERDVRQRARADHRPVRARRRPARGRQGVTARLDPRQLAARSRRRRVRRRPRPRPPALRPLGRLDADDDADARGRRARDAGHLRARRGLGPAEPGRRDRRLRLDGRVPVARGRRGAHPDLRRGPVVLAQDPPRPLQPARRGPRHRCRGAPGTAGRGPREPRRSRGRRRSRRRRSTGSPGRPAGRSSRWPSPGSRSA